MGSKKLIPDENKLRNILEGVRNVLLASLGDMEETEHFLTSYEFENLYRPPLGSKNMIPDENKLRNILEGVRNVPLASFGDMTETWRRQSTSGLARTLKFYTDVPWGLG